MAYAATAMDYGNVWNHGGFWSHASPNPAFHPHQQNASNSGGLEGSETAGFNDLMAAAAAPLHSRGREGAVVAGDQ